MKRTIKKESKNEKKEDKHAKLDLDLFAHAFNVESSKIGSNMKMRTRKDQHGEVLEVKSVDPLTNDQLNFANERLKRLVEKIAKDEGIKMVHNGVGTVWWEDD